MRTCYYLQLVYRRYSVEIMQQWTGCAKAQLASLPDILTLPAWHTIASSFPDRPRAMSSVFFFPSPKSRGPAIVASSPALSPFHEFEKSWGRPGNEATAIAHLHFHFHFRSHFHRSWFYHCPSFPGLSPRLLSV